MTEPAVTPPTRLPLVARGEQLVLVILSVALAAGVAYRALRYWRAGADPFGAELASTPSFQVNVNSADWATLALVPGLGEVLSKRIVEARDAMPGKRFASLDDLKAVRGINDRTLEKLRPYLVVGDVADEGVRMVPVEP